MIKFKTLKFRHYREAQALNKRIEAEEASDEDVLLFALALVEEWDFVDADTGEPLALGELDELSLEQCGELNREFARRLGVAAEVPKKNDVPSSSTSTP